ncbi:DUF6088 family protein [Capnocytophaga canimorsus]|nr:DUF6088 family protein [Capnocytophaga canimorsus]WGU71117.1 DUF6088 family protein [Capnocytophaga canimorsus]
MKSIDNKILDKIKKAKRGTLFYTEDFLSFGTHKAISKGLERLVNKGEIFRVARGGFCYFGARPYFRRNTAHSRKNCRVHTKKR